MVQLRPAGRPALKVVPVFVLSVAGVVSSAAGVVLAVAPADAPPPAEGFQVQDLDDPVLPLEPLKPRQPGEQARLDARSWYMTGQLRESRNDSSGALEAYRKAVELDPRAVEVYRALVPLAFNLNQTSDALKYAAKAVELDPEDHLLLRRLGIHMVEQGELGEAVKLFEQAAASSRLDKKSGIYVTLQRDLAVLYGAQERTEEAADAYEIVFDALVNPGRFELDFRTRAVLLADPSTTFERIGQTFLQARRPELAVRAFERAARAQRGRPGALSFNLAQVYFQTDQYDKAEAELQKYFDAQLQSKGRDAYQLLIQVLNAQEQADQVIGRLEQLAAKDPRNSTLQFFLAEQYLAADRLDEAEELYKKTLASAGEPEGYLGLAGIYRRRGQPEELLDVLSKAVQSGQSLEQVQGSLGGLDAEMQAIAEDEKLVEGLIAAGRKRLKDDEQTLEVAAGLILAKLAADAKQTGPMIEFYRFALQARRDRAPLIYEEFGRNLLLAGEYAEAVKVYQEAVENPAAAAAKPNFLYRLSQAHAFNEDTEAALETVREARRLLPEHPELHFHEAWVHYHARRWDDAVRLFEQFIEKHSQQGEIVRRAQFSLSNIHVQRGDMRKGEEILEKIYEQDPDDPAVNNDLGYLYADQGKNLEQAEKMIRKAVEAEPENAAYLDSMGWVLYQQEKYDEALPYLEKAVSLPSGSDATLYEHLGDCYDRLGKTDKAVESWQTALEHARKATQPDEEQIDKIENKLKARQEPTSENAESP